MRWLPFMMQQGRWFLKLQFVHVFLLHNESLRETDGSLNRHVDRNKYKLVQTPQTFYSDKIKEAYLQSYHEHFTDDASVLESTGEPIQLIEGNQQNIKITTEEDLLYASSILNLS